MKDALSYIIYSIVSDPSKASIEDAEENGTYNYTIVADKDEMGKLIGKDGKVIRAIRNVMKIPAIKQNVRITISLAER